jgi:predicted anti-sigma-YlaC factor YlaD
MFPGQQGIVVEMHCMAARRLIVDYLDGDLDLEILVRIDAHLEHCDHCWAIVDGVRNVVALLGSEEAFMMPDDLRDRLFDWLPGHKDSGSS